MKSLLLATLGAWMMVNAAAQNPSSIVSGQIVDIKGQRATVLNAQGQRQTVSLASGTTLRVGERVTLSLEPVGDTVIARRAPARPR